MIVGYLLIGSLGGFAAAILYVWQMGGGILGAIGLFYLVTTLSVLALGVFRWLVPLGDEAPVPQPEMALARRKDVPTRQPVGQFESARPPGPGRSPA